MVWVRSPAKDLFLSLERALYFLVRRNSPEAIATNSLLPNSLTSDILLVLDCRDAIRSSHLSFRRKEVDNLNLNFNLGCSFEGHHVKCIALGTMQREFSLCVE